MISPDPETADELRRRGGPTIVVGADRNAAEDWLQAVLAVLPAQAAALWLAERLGVEVDRPHGLHKVTLTR
jgi:glucosamine 6-phosphate synthetase-like amidotransferase/phosphosugar isomerase protein